MFSCVLSVTSIEVIIEVMDGITDFLFLNLTIFHNTIVQ